ncbi:MAG: hypothetical protein QM699_00600 [Amaricoccus sp.]|uniref:hypothetical protein n=1 Tax=Amaricoccus sp. TaxID=1872485 RepID=UPI0039E5125C
METKVLLIHVLPSNKTGLLVAMSPDMPGFLAHGHSAEELKAHIVAALGALIEAQGMTLVHTKFLGDEPIGSFERTTYKVEAETALAA